MPFSTYGLCWFFWQYDQNIACFLYISKWPSALSSCLNTCQTKPHAVLLKCSWRLGHIIYWWIGHDRLHQQLVHTHNSPCHDDPLLCCIVTSCISGRGNRIGPVCVCMCVCLSVCPSFIQHFHSNYIMWHPGRASVGQKDEETYDVGGTWMLAISLSSKGRLLSFSTYNFGLV